MACATIKTGYQLSVGLLATNRYTAPNPTLILASACASSCSSLVAIGLTAGGAASVGLLPIVGPLLPPLPLSLREPARAPLPQRSRRHSQQAQRLWRPQ